MARPTSIHLIMVTMATMAWSKVMLLLSFILLQVAWVDAYSIDESCARQFSMLSYTLKKILTHETAIKDTLIDAVQKSMKLAEDAGTALEGNDPNINELKGWFFADYRLDTVKGQLSEI
jgi:hypothetical protein